MLDKTLAVATIAEHQHDKDVAMKPQRYSHRDPHPNFRFHDEEEMTPNLRALFSDLVYGVVIGLALAFVFVEYLA